MELILIEAHPAILAWLQQVSDTPNFRNDPHMPVVNPVVVYHEVEDKARQDAWEGVSEEERPVVQFMDND